MNKNEKEALVCLSDALSNAFAEFHDALADAEPIQPRRRSTSLIDKLESPVREQIVSMLRSDRYFYADIIRFAKEHGVEISRGSLCRYYKRLQGAKHPIKLEVKSPTINDMEAFVKAIKEHPKSGY